MAIGKTVKLDKAWELQAVVLEKRMGVSDRTGEEWFSVKIGGFTFFDAELYKEVQEGDKVILKGEYVSDRYNKRNQTYTPQHELDGVLVVGGAFVEAPAKMQHVNGNGLSKGQPA